MYRRRSLQLLYTRRAHYRSVMESGPLDHSLLAGRRRPLSSCSRGSHSDESGGGGKPYTLKGKVNRSDARSYGEPSRGRASSTSSHENDHMFPWVPSSFVARPRLCLPRPLRAANSTLCLASVSTAPIVTFAMTLGKRRRDLPHDNLNYDH